MEKQTSTKIPRTPNEFLGYSNKSTKHIYMLSEFIDNSIQSAIDCGLKNVDIEIKVNMNKEQIYIIDNAGGIEFSKRAKAIQNGRDDDELGNNLNMFGVGMKMAAFWFGKRLKIYSKYINDNFAYSMELDIDKLRERDYQTEDIENIDIFNYTGERITEHGTVLVIDKIHKDKNATKKRYDKSEFFKTSDDSTSLHIQLASRFSRYLKSKFLTIKITYLNVNGLIDINNGQSYIIDNSKIPSLFVSKDDFIDEKTKINIKDSNFTNYNKRIKELKQYFDGKMEKNFGFQGLSIAKIFEKFENQQEFKFECTFDAGPDFNNEIIPFSFGFLAKRRGTKFTMYNGLSVYQDNRAIISGPNPSKANSICWLTYDQAISRDSHKLNDRFSGEIDLNNKDIFPVDNNKMAFLSDVENKICKIISDKMSDSDFQKIFMELIDILDFRGEQVESDEKIRKINNQFNKKINEMQIISGFETNIIDGITLSTNDGQEERAISTFEVKEENDENNKYYLNWLIVENIKNNQQLFATETLFTEDKGLIYCIMVNKNYFGFKKNLKEEAFSILMNPIITLILKSISHIGNTEWRTNEFVKIVGIFEGNNYE